MNGEDEGPMDASAKPHRWQSRSTDETQSAVLIWKSRNREGTNLSLHTAAIDNHKTHGKRLLPRLFLPANLRE